MIRYIKNSDLTKEEFLEDSKAFFWIAEKAGFPKNVNSIHVQRQVQYPVCFNLLKLKGNEKVLDAGCGYTVWPYFIKELYPDIEMHVYDRSKPHLDRYTDKFVKKEGDLTAISYPDESFDVVYCVSTLEHVDNWETAVEELSRIVKKGGYLLMIVDGMIGDRYFKEQNLDMLLRLLRRHFEMGEVDLSNEDNWIYSGVEGTTMSLITLLKKKI